MIRDDLHALLARVEAATGPDRELDAAISIALARPDWARDYPLEPWANGRVGVVGHETCPTFWTSERYTGSLDAAVGLVERVLPGWWWDVCTYQPGRYEAFVNPPDYQGPDTHPCGMGMHAVPALALCAALLRALIARDTQATP